MSGGAQQGVTLTRDDVPVTNGVFTVQLDFSATPFNGAARWLQISVRAGASSGAFTALNPRQPLNATPYAIRSASAANADTLDGMDSSQFVSGQVVRSVNGLTNNVTISAGSGITRTPAGNTLTIASTGGILNQTTAQTTANFNIDGTGTANIFNAATQFNIGGNRVLATPRTNTFVGIFAGAHADSLSVDNTFVGRSSGDFNTTGIQNSFVGTFAGSNNTTGSQNAFFGSGSGSSNLTGSSNTLVGSNTDVGAFNLTFATAIGSGTAVATSNTIQLGRTNGSDRIVIPGNLTVSGAATFSDLLTASDGLALQGSRLRLSPLATDTNHSIGYNSAINGIQFNAFDSFLWVNVRNNRINMQLLTNGDLSIVGNYNQISDARYKTNVQTFGNALDTIMRLRGVRFNWKPEQNDNQRLQIGFIAQEVEAVLPELVSTDDKGFKSVAYANAVPVLVEALKEQQRRFAAENAALKAQLAALVERLTQLEQQAAPRPR